MKHLLNINDWARKDHFHFFRQFEEPFFGITATVDCTQAYATAKEQDVSFFLYYMHQSLVVANQLEPFKYRIAGDDIFVFDTVNASPTINRPDGTFGFAYMDYHNDFSSFAKAAQTEIDKVQNSTGLIPATQGQNVIHYSSIPWINFTSISHARSFSFKDSIPKISFGKMTLENGKRQMPVSVHVHHGLMDGSEVGKFFEAFQELMTSPPVPSPLEKEKGRG